jgi:hypothetical protein
MYDGSITIGTRIDTKDFKAQIKKVEDDLSRYEQELSVISSAKSYDKQIEDVKEYSSKIEKLNNQLVDLRKKQAELERGNLDNIHKSLGKASDNVTNVLKKMGRWALAVFAVESAYGFVRNAISQVSQYNDQVANDIEFIRYSIATVLEPIIVRIVDLVKRLLALINALSIRIFGVDLFSRATAENFNKAQKSASKLKKTLAGFDTANVLNDNGSTNGISMGQGEIIDWDEETAKMNSWLETSTNKIQKWSSNLSSKWKNLGKDMETALYNPSAFSKAFGAWDMFVYGITETFYGLWETVDGFVQMIFGLFQILVGVLLGDADLIEKGWKNMFNGLVKFLEGIVTIVVGIVRGIAGLIKGIISEVISGIKGMLNILISAVNTVIKGINKIKVKNPFDKSQNWSPNIPYIPTFKMATGGIINAPNKGVPIASNVYGGEAGREGVLPLTDEQTMEELGREIGRHITVNIDWTNKLDGRVLSKGLVKINKNKDFANNGG